MTKFLFKVFFLWYLIFWIFVLLQDTPFCFCHFCMVFSCEYSILFHSKTLGEGHKLLPFSVSIKAKKKKVNTFRLRCFFCHADVTCWSTVSQIIFLTTEQLCAGMTCTWWPETVCCWHVAQTQCWPFCPTADLSLCAIYPIPRVSKKTQMNVLKTIDEVTLWLTCFCVFNTNMWSHRLNWRLCTWVCHYMNVSLVWVL